MIFLVQMWFGAYWVSQLAAAAILLNAVEGKKDAPAQR